MVHLIATRSDVNMTEESLTTVASARTTNRTCSAGSAQTVSAATAGLEYSGTPPMGGVVGQPPAFVIDAYHQLWRIEKAFRMSKHDLQARPIYHRTRDSIEAHLNVVFAAMAVSHWIEHQTGWSIKKFVRTARRCRTVTIQAGSQTLVAAEPPPADLAEALAKIHELHAH